MRKLFFSLFVLGALVNVGCHSKKSASTAPHRTLKVVRVQQQMIPTPMNFTSQLSSNYSAVIQPRISGYLTSKNYEKGMPVKRGQLLYTIDPSQINTQLLEAEASLNAARAEAIEARNNYERAVPLAKIEAISRSQLDQYTAAYKSAEASVRSAEQQLRNAQIESGYTRIYSPIDGVIGQTTASVGDYVGMGTEFSTLATIENLDTVTVRLAIPVSEYLTRREGDDAPAYDNGRLLSNIRLYMSDGALYPYEGSYAYTEQNVGSQTGTIVVVVNFPNPMQVLKAGQYARVSADVGEPQASVLVPQRCVVQSLDRANVWVVKSDSSLVYRQVTLGPTVDSLWVVRSGLSDGEQVLVEGVQRARAGQRIIPVEIK
ncbi:MAG: efflux RND transporter periplasmic adaptor subunit [Rikenellaceae bacterium]|nr:efflux RND transporter periplasmic adaptor subunit [Rikenellaceae bacterium]